MYSTGQSSSRSRKQSQFVAAKQASILKTRCQVRLCMSLHRFVSPETQPLGLSDLTALCGIINRLLQDSVSSRYYTQEEGQILATVLGLPEDNSWKISLLSTIFACE